MYQCINSIIVYYNRKTISINKNKVVNYYQSKELKY